MIIFCAGLMKDPRPLINYMYEMQIGDYFSRMGDSGVYPSIDANLFKSLFTESQLPDHPLHNQYVNYYHHEDDERKKRPCDITPIYFPSRVYHFERMKEAVVLENHLSAAAQIPNFAMYIGYPRKAATTLLQTCSEIFTQQGATHLTMVDVTCHHSTLETLKFTNPQSLWLRFCNLPNNFVRSLLNQLFGSGDSLQRLWMDWMDLSPFESLLNELLEDLVAHHKTQKGQRKLNLELEGFTAYPTNLSKLFIQKWRERCRGVESIDCWIIH